MSIDPFWSYSSIEHHFFVGSACSSMRYRRLGSCNHRAIPLRVVCQSNRPMSFQHSWAQQKHLTITFSECVSVWVCVCVCVCVGDGDIRMKNKKERVVAICFVHAWACFKRSAASSRRRLWGTAGPATTRAGGRRSAGRAATPAGTGSRRRPATPPATPAAARRRRRAAPAALLRAAAAAPPPPPAHNKKSVDSQTWGKLPPSGSNDPPTGIVSFLLYQIVSQTWPKLPTRGQMTHQWGSYPFPSLFHQTVFPKLGVNYPKGVKWPTQRGFTHTHTHKEKDDAAENTKPKKRSKRRRERERRPARRRRRWGILASDATVPGRERRRRGRSAGGAPGPRPPVGRRPAPPAPLRGTFWFKQKLKINH